MQARQPDYDFWEDDDEVLDEDVFEPLVNLRSLPAKPRQPVTPQQISPNPFQEIARVQEEMRQMMIQMRQNPFAEFARAAPEFFGLITMKQMGGGTISIEDVEETIKRDEVERRVWGIKVGSDVTTSTTTHRKIRRYNVS